MQPAKSKRTNSLAFSKTDCHTCTLLGQRCDRRRPQCSMCLSNGRKCGGFATPLVWDNRRMLDESSARASGKNAEQAIRARTPSPSTSGTSRRFRFVTGPSRATKRRKTNHRPIELSPLPDVHDNLEAAAGDIQLYNDPTSNFLDDFDSAAFLLDNTSIFDTGVPGACGPLFHNQSQGISVPDVSDLAVMSPPAPSNTTDRDEPGSSDNRDQLDPFSSILVGSAPPPLPNSQIDLRIQDAHAPNGSPSPSQRYLALGLYDPATNQHDSLLKLYDSEYCVLPLTSDIRVNPFRSQPRILQRSGLLLYSILALCCQHMDRLTGSWFAEAVEHRRQATQLLEYAVQNVQNKDGFHLLEPILIMFTLDCTLSAAGNWSKHLTRAYSVLQACGGPSALNSSHIRSQVGMLIWWDATLALVSRQGPIIDEAYLNFLVRWEQEDEWSFFDLAGCPRELVVYLYQLAELGRQSGIASSMKWLTFDRTPVIATEQKITAWENGFGSPCETDQDISAEEAEKQHHSQQDRYHCSEAWRYALLIYIERVFNQHPRRGSMARLVRATIDHVRCCRRTSQTQKQLLLPVLLAGSETTDQDMRDYVKEYCGHWGKTTRYNMFNSVPALLDEIWSTGKWWGAVIDGKTNNPPGQGQAVTQFLFG